MAGRMFLNAGTLTVASFLSTGLVIGHAFYQKEQFYPSIVYLTRSNPSMAVLYIQALVLVALFGKIMKAIFFGQLRAVESENLMERAWYAVTETCLAFTVFRDDFSPRFVALFTLLLFLKCFHWLAEDRVDFMERSPVITLTFHARMMGLMAVLSSMDSYFVSHAYFTTLVRGASVQIVFGFEYAILMTIVFHVAIKYILHTIDLRNVHPWEQKAVYLLYTELIIDFLRVVLYSLFMFVMIRLHTFPLFAIRPFYLTIRAFKKALNDVVMSRKAIYAMNYLFPDATAEDISSADNVCIVCREEMTPGAKKLPCGHIFHTACLRSWFQRQQTCPTCRSDILTMAHLRTTPGGAARPQAAAAQAGAPAAAAQPQPAAGQAVQPQAQPAQPDAAQLGAPPQPHAHPHYHVPNVAAMFPFIPPGFMPQPPGVAGVAAQHHAAHAAAVAQHHQQHQQQAAGSATTARTTTTTPSPSISGTPTTTLPLFLRSPLLPPPFMSTPPAFPPLGGGGGMNFGLPFPTPPSVGGLSDEEVRRMEGRERAAVEARIQSLRNIQTLLDAAVVQLQQYTSILGALATTPQFTSPTTPGAPSADSATEAENSQQKEKANEKVSEGENPGTSGITSAKEITPEVKTKSVEPHSSASKSPMNGESSADGVENASSPSLPNLDPEAEKVRQRRLQHFERKPSDGN